VESVLAVVAAAAAVFAGQLGPVAEAQPAVLAAGQSAVCSASELVLLVLGPSCTVLAGTVLAFVAQDRAQERPESFVELPVLPPSQH